MEHDLVVDGRGRGNCREGDVGLLYAEKGMYVRDGCRYIQSFWCVELAILLQCLLQ